MTAGRLAEVFAIYEVLRDALRVTRKCIREDCSSCLKETIFSDSQKESAICKINDAERKLEDVMVMSLFASFESELKMALIETIEKNLEAKKIGRLAKVIGKKIGRWGVTEIAEVFKDDVKEGTSQKVNEVGKYRSWVAHGNVGQSVMSRRWRCEPHHPHPARKYREP